MPGRGSPSTTMMHDVRRSNFSAAPNKRSPHVRTVVDDQRRQTAWAQLPNRPQNSPRFEGGEVIEHLRKSHLPPLRRGALHLRQPRRRCVQSQVTPASLHTRRAFFLLATARRCVEGSFHATISSRGSATVTGGPPEPPNRSRTYPAPPISIPKPPGHL